MDREIRSTYDLVVLCSEFCDDQNDKGDNANSSAHLHVRIELSDISDHRPLFAKRFYSIGLVVDDDLSKEAAIDDSDAILSSHVRLKFDIFLYYSSFEG